MHLRSDAIDWKKVYETNYFSIIESKLVFFLIRLNMWGGVEGTRLKAKDTKKSEAQAKDRLSGTDPLDSRGQEKESSRPKTNDTTQVLSKKNVKFQQNFGVLQKKKSWNKIRKRGLLAFFVKFRRSPKTNKKVFIYFPRGLWRATRRKKMVMTLAHFQQIKDRSFSRTCRLWGQGQGLDLRSQRLQIVSLRTSSKPRTSSRTPPLLNMRLIITNIQLSGFELVSSKRWAFCLNEQKTLPRLFSNCFVVDKFWNDWSDWLSANLTLH